MKRTLEQSHAVGGGDSGGDGNRLFSGGSICARPHVRAKKMDAWKKASPLAGYLQWREMQLFMNEQMKSVLMNVATVSILPASGQSELEKLKCPNTIQAYADNDVCHDADVKFFLDGTHRIHPNSLFCSTPPLPAGAGGPTTGPAAPNAPASQQSGLEHGLPAVVLVGSDLHISVALVGEGGKHVEFFDSKGGNVSVRQIRAFFHSRGCAKFLMINRVNFQEDGNCAEEAGLDIYCNTWIYYWCYLRLVRKKKAKDIVSNIDKMNSKERLEEIQKFQTWLYDLPNAKHAGRVATKSVSVGNPFEPGAVDVDTLAIRERNELRLNRAGGRGKSLVVRGPRRGGRKKMEREIICKINKKLDAGCEWYVRDPSSLGRGVTQFFEVPESDLPYRTFRSVKSDLIDVAAKNGLVPAILSSVVEDFFALRQKASGEKENSARGSSKAAKAKWKGFRLKSRIRSGSFRGGYEIVVDGVKNPLFNESRKRGRRGKGSKLSERVIMYLTRATYGEFWTLLRNPYHDKPFEDIFQKDQDRDQAEQDSLEEERSRKFFVPHMFTGKLMEDSNNVLGCSSGKECRSWVHIRGLDPPHNTIPPGDWVCSRCSGRGKQNKYEYTF